jgi:virulence factor Mce-like protein
MPSGGRQRGRELTPFKAGLLALVVIGVLSYFGWTRSNPFLHPYELRADFRTVNSLKPSSPVRIAGVEVGKVKKVEPAGGGSSGGRVTMEIERKALPIHKDARLKIRPRIFLEGNFFVDLQPGSPSAPTLKDGSTIPSAQTAAPVQFGDVLSALDSDVRKDLQTLVREYSKGLQGGGARGLNQTLRYGEEAYRNTALVNDAALGQEPDKDLERVLRGQARTAEALTADERSLKDLVTNLNITAGALAREDVPLEASVPALRDVLRVGEPALASLNDSLPTLRAFAREALPGVRSTGPMIDATLPFVRQARALVSPRELGGLSTLLRRYAPSLAQLGSRSVPLIEQARALSACTNSVLLPFANSRIPDVAEPGDNKDQPVVRQLQRGFPGLAGESRLSDGTSTFFHVEAVAAGQAVQPAPPPDGGSQPPPRRPDVPCETQEPPNLAAPVARLPLESAANIPPSLLPPGIGSLPALPPPTPGAAEGPALGKAALSRLVARMRKDASQVPASKGRDRR